MPKVFHGITIPDPIAAEMNAKFGMEWTVGHIVGWLLEREVSRWCEEHEIATKKPIETPKHCHVIQYTADEQAYVGESDKKLTLCGRQDACLLRFLTKDAAEEFAKDNGIPLGDLYNVKEIEYDN